MNPTLILNYFEKQYNQKLSTLEKLKQTAKTEAQIQEVIDTTQIIDLLNQAIETTLTLEEFNNEREPNAL
jgi:hypothetical protein